MDVLGLPAIAQARGLTTYDAAYLELATRLELPLVPPTGLSEQPPRRPASASSERSTRMDTAQMDLIADEQVGETVYKV
jgi:hypothetical protein